DTAADDDERHAAGENAVDGSLAERVAVRTGFEEGAVRIQNHAQNEDQREGEECARGGGTHAVRPIADSITRAGVASARSSRAVSSPRCITATLSLIASSSGNSLDESKTAIPSAVHWLIS